MSRKENLLGGGEKATPPPPNKTSSPLHITNITLRGSPFSPAPKFKTLRIFLINMQFRNKKAKGKVPLPN